MMASAAVKRANLVKLSDVVKFVQSGCATGKDAIARPSLGVVGVAGNSAVSADGYRLHVARFGDETARVSAFDGDEPGFAWDVFFTQYDRSDNRAVSLRVHRLELIRMVKLARVWDEEIMLYWGDDSGWLTVSGSSYEGDSSGSLPAQYVGPGRRGDSGLRISAKRLVDSLKGLRSEFIELSFVAKWGDFDRARRAVWLRDSMDTDAGACELLALIVDNFPGESMGPEVIKSYYFDLDHFHIDRPLYPAAFDTFTYGCDRPKSCAVKSIKAYPHQLIPGPAIVPSRASWDTSPAPAVDYNNRVRLAGMLAGRANAVGDKRAQARAESFALRYMRSGGVIARLESMAFIDGVKEGKLWYAENDNAEHSAFIIERLRLASLIYARLEKRQAEAVALHLNDVTGALYEEVKIGARLERLQHVASRLRNSLHYVFHGRAVDAENEGKARKHNWESADDARA